jgi:CRISPR/Cas system-associated endoribonuclease Cas2
MPTASIHQPDCHIRLKSERLEVIDEEQDRLVAYKLDARCAKETETAGTMACSEKAVCYLV